ncbi:ESCRT-I complex subunit VPS37 [Fistulifera solaris]|uniref:ESCRT-I complex subunit VPS37 n=1 Tax=Fistulifera solaris TaxID=1519565 RepID=A0A1Z5KAJ2_FISSO|nr:ESCRT-I complex subunit VPS37 [Fistulifera solaris]|eukprot:GAX23121.1 ESCRT-I complex subunit VPS37 [Fistulifera solaris]
MFQWNSSNGAATTNRMRYPGQRTTVVTAQSIQGTIRPPSEYTHAQHLDSYLEDAILKPSTKVVGPGNETFHTFFRCVNGDTFVLRVHFNESRVPQMILHGVEVTHPWVDRQGCITGFAPLQSETAWRDSRLLLGQAVHHVIQELQTHPPILHRITDPTLERNQQNRVRSSSSTSSTTIQPMEEEPPSYSSLLHETHVEMPAVPTEFPELERLDREQLDALLSDELEFQAFCNKLDSVKTLVTMVTSVVDENATLARQNWEKKSELHGLYERATELQQQLREKVATFRTLEQQQDQLYRPVDSKKVIKDLIKAKKEAFDQSEQFADNWIDQQGNVDDFLAKFLEVRRLHHVRAAKLELLEGSL